jgi:hypothetical protein
MSTDDFLMAPGVQTTFRKRKPQSTCFLSLALPSVITFRRPYPANGCAVQTSKKKREQERSREATQKVGKEKVICTKGEGGRTSL